MHLHVRAHDKGRCPECNMFLVEESSLAAPEGEATQEAHDKKEGMKHDEAE